MTNEIWKDIPGYEGLYQASNLGRIKSLGNNRDRKEKILKNNPHPRGYLQVALWKNGKGKSLLIHRLVAITFLENPLDLPEINHIDENKHNNAVDNLEWTAHAPNCNYGTRNQRIARKVLCVELDRVFDSVKEAAEFLGLSAPNITYCCRGKQKSCGNFHWRYADDTTDNIA